MRFMRISSNQSSDVLVSEQPHSFPIMKNSKINQPWSMVPPYPVAATKSQSSAMRYTLKLRSTRAERVISATRIFANIRSQRLDQPLSFWHIKYYDRQTLIDDIMPYMAESLLGSQPLRWILKEYVWAERTLPRMNNTRAKYVCVLIALGFYATKERCT
jgi:hypothetical protein